MTRSLSKQACLFFVPIPFSIHGVWAIIAASGATRKTDKNKVVGPFHPLNINRSFPKNYRGLYYPEPILHAKFREDWSITVACIVFTNYNGQTDGRTDTHV